MFPFRWSFRSQFLLGFMACAALLGYALYVQFQLQILPCQFCIFQRLAFAALGLVFLIGALHAPRAAGSRRAWSFVAVVAAIVGMGYSGRHAWVQMFPPEMPGCGPGLNFMVESQGYLGAARQVLMATGDCSAIDWKFLGLSMPMWCLLWFIGLALWALYAGFKRRQTYLFRR